MHPIVLVTACDGIPIQEPVDLQFPESGKHVSQAFREVIAAWEKATAPLRVSTFSCDLLNGVLNYCESNGMRELVTVHLHTESGVETAYLNKDAALINWRYGVMNCSETC
jgi:hypothetical protein